MLIFVFNIFANIENMHYLRLITILIVTIWHSILVIVHLVFAKKPDFHRYARCWAKKLLRIARIQIKIEGIENINPNETYIFVANHSSLFDIPVLQASIPNDFRIIYKKELEKVPIFGYGLKKSPYIGIVREDPRQSMQSVEQAILTIQNGASVLVFPEGTRTKDGNLGEPHRGAFRLATRSEKPIVPIAIKGTYEILSNGISGIKPRTVRLKIGQPIHKMPQNRVEEVALQNETWDIIKKFLAEM